MRSEQITFAILRSLANKDWLQKPLNRALAPLNPFDRRRHIDPYALYKAARHEGPIFHNRMAQTWMVTGYQEAMEVLRGPVSVDRRHTMEAIVPYRNLQPENIDLMMSSILMRDAPDHGRLRTLVNRAFTPRAVIDVTPKVVELVDELLAELVTDEPTASGTRQPRTVDVMAEVANRLPIYTIGEMLGLPRSQREVLKALSDVVAQFVDPFTVFDATEMDDAIDELRTLFADLADERTRDPQADLLTALVQAEDDGTRLTRNELISMVILLLIAGHETTSGLIGNSLVALGRNRDARDLLLQRPDLTKNAVEEFLRYDSPVQATDRTVLEDFHVAGKRIPAGAIVMVFFGAANRDPRRYRDPDRLLLDREDPRPLSFGHGIHHCLGAALARIQAGAVIPAFVEAFPEFQVDEDGLTWRRSTTLRGPKTLPMVLSPRLATASVP